MTTAQTATLPDEFPDDDADTTPSGDTPAAPGSQLSSLRARREAAVRDLHTDLPVPRIDPPVYVRFKPVEQAKVDAANKRAAASKDKHATVNANASVLADACLGIFEIVDDVAVSIDPDDRDGAWPRFGPRLAALLGIRAGKASQVVRDPEVDAGLYLTDGDVIATAQKLAEWSGYTDELMERDEGN